MEQSVSRYLESSSELGPTLGRTGGSRGGLVGSLGTVGVAMGSLVGLLFFFLVRGKWCDMPRDMEIYVYTYIDIWINIIDL